MKLWLMSSLLVFVSGARCLSAFAIAPSNVTASRNSSSSPAGMALIEWNPADLLDDRVRIDGEYIIVDGFAFGVATEFQRKLEENWNFATGGIGLTATQYLTSQTLDGLFLKGELNFFATSFEGKKARQSESGTQAWMAVGADAGYRFSFVKRVTGAASYGVRRNLTEFFAPKESSNPHIVRDNIRAWEPRLQLSLGISI